MLRALRHARGAPSAVSAGAGAASRSANGRRGGRTRQVPAPTGGTFLPVEVASALLVGDRATRVRVQHAPADQLLGQDRGRLVVDDGQGAQVVLADRQHLAVVVAALALDRRGVALQRAGLLRRARGRAAPGRGPASAAARRPRPAWCPAAAPAPGRRRSPPARRGAARSRRGRRARTNRPRRPSSGPGTSPRRRGGKGPAGCGWRGAWPRAVWRIRWTYSSPDAVSTTGGSAARLVTHCEVTQRYSGCVKPNGPHRLIRARGRRTRGAGHGPLVAWVAQFRRPLRSVP